MLDNNDLQKIDQRIQASERRLKKDLKEKIGQMFIASEKRVMKEIGDFISDRLAPEIEERADKSTTDRLNNRMDHMTDKVVDHENRIKKLENVALV